MQFLLKYINEQAQKLHWAIAWTFVILAGCSLPGSGVPVMKFGIDKVVHCLMMAGFGFLWLFHSRRIWLVIFCGITYGFALEIWQHVLPIGRTFDVFDGIADAVGVILGTMVWKIWPRLE